MGQWPPPPPCWRLCSVYWKWWDADALAGVQSPKKESDTKVGRFWSLEEKKMEQYKLHSRNIKRRRKPPCLPLGWSFLVMWLHLHAAAATRLSFVAGDCIAFPPLNINSIQTESMGGGKKMAQKASITVPPINVSDRNQGVERGEKKKNFESECEV